MGSEPSCLVVPAVKVGPIDRLLELIVATTGLNRYYFHTTLVQLAGYPAVPIVHLLAEVETMSRESKVVNSIAAVPRRWLRLQHSRWPIAEETDLVRPNQRQLVVEQGFAHPMDFVVEQAPGPNRELVVGETDLVRPNQRQLVVEQASVDPILMVAVEHPRC